MAENDDARGTLNRRRAARLIQLPRRITTGANLTLQIWLLSAGSCTAEAPNRLLCILLWLSPKSCVCEGQCDNYNRKSYKPCNNMTRVNFLRYVGHVTIFSWMFTIACCLVIASGLGLGLWFRFIVCGWLVVRHTYLYYFRLSLSHCLHGSIT